MSGKGKNKPARCRRAATRTVSTSVLKEQEQVHGLAQGTLKNYKSTLAQGDAWLLLELQHLMREQAQARGAQQAQMADTALLPSNQCIPEDGSAKDAFTVPMECTPHLIALFMYSKCVSEDTTSDSTDSSAGSSVLKTIHAAFMHRFEWA
jgi:hypothetical protein